jgi:glycosyltransferase involved in cell wall biosynthesis
VGVPVFEDVRFLDDCIESLLVQKQTPHEVILVNDGSVAPEATAAIKRWSEHSLVRVVRQPNRGVCVARNAALDLMTGDAFVFVDADDLLHPEFIRACASALQSNPDVLAVACWTEFFGDYEGVEAKPPFDHRVGLRENPIVSTSALVDMEVRDMGIRFAPDLAFLYCEDWDVWSQIAAAGGKFGLVPRPLARHRVHSASGGHQRTDLGFSLGKARASYHLKESST